MKRKPVTNRSGNGKWDRTNQSNNSKNYSAVRLLNGQIVKWLRQSSIATNKQFTNETI